MAHLYIIRGLPGSGKSTFAKRLLDMSDMGCWVEHWEADMFMHGRDGYKFQPEMLKEAHRLYQVSVFKGLEYKGVYPDVQIIVSNTFTRIWEMQPYIDYCKENGHTFTVITCEGNYGNIHDVPSEAIERMKKRWEKYEPGVLNG